MDHEVWTCSWLVERWPDDPDWYPDSRSDLLAECGAPVTELPNGWRCEAGHSHFTGVEYYDDEELAGIRQARLPLPANAARMDGSPVR